MAENAGKPERSPLSELSSRLDAARKDAALDGDPPDEQRGRALGQGFSLGSELLAAMIVGPLLGLGLDRLTGTGPWGLIGGIFLGFAAGVLNVSRAMKAAANSMPSMRACEVLKGCQMSLVQSRSAQLTAHCQLIRLSTRVRKARRSQRSAPGVPVRPINRSSKALR